MKSNSPILCLTGPTAAGKTDAALLLAQHFPCEIISVDSVMVYRDMDIGSAKPSLEERQAVPHHLIDILDPAQSYSAAQFASDATQLIEEIIQRQRLPLLVGGTLLYYRALLEGLSPLPTADETIRQQLSDEAKALGWPALHQRLQTIDPIAAERIKPHDQQRIQRALEVFLISGKTMTEWWQTTAKPSLPNPVINMALIPNDRAYLHQRIAERFQQMLQQGLIEEVQQLYQRGDLHPQLPAIRAVGYRQVWQYLDGELSFDAMTEKAIIATRQYAKRQLTWLRSLDDLTRFDSEDPSHQQKIIDFVKQQLA